jgi:hypothetical protein
MSRRPAALVATLALAILAAAGPAAAAIRYFSYDPANDATRRASGALTFQFQQRLVFVTILALESTEQRASVSLKPADEHVLGSGGLSRLIGRNAQERDLYAVETGNQGPELVRALCPGSTRAWLAFSRLASGAPLRIQVIGDASDGGPARLCETLDFTFRGEWKLPTAAPSIRQQDMLVPRYPSF